MAENKIKVQVNLNPDLVKKIDFYANAMGISRSALCAVFIGQGIMNYDNSNKLIEGVADFFGKSLLSDDAIAYNYKMLGEEAKKN